MTAGAQPETTDPSVNVKRKLSEKAAYLWRYGEASEGIPVQDVCPCIIDDDIRTNLVQRPLRVKLHLLEVL